MVNDIAIQDFVNSIREQPTDTNNNYSAVVARVDNEGVAWVHIQGSDKETPTVSSATEVKQGDKVNVTWKNNGLYIGGNYTNPSAGIQRVGEVETVASEAKGTADEAYVAANNAVHDAERARIAAESAEADASSAAASATQAQQSASQAQQSATQAQQSASSAGENASRAQAASQAAQAAALGSITTDTIHYLATPLGSGVTRSTAGWTTTIQTMTATNKYLWTYHTYTTAGGSSTDTDPIITGTYGEKGADGTSVTILGSYNTLAELQQAHPTGNLGDAYMVSGDLYVWNGSAWQDVGQIQGPQGPQGIPGNSITVSSVAYAVTSTEQAPQSYPYSSPPTVPEGSWLWTKTTFSDGSSAIMKAKQGESGNTPTITTTKDGKITTILADGQSIGTVIDGSDGSSPTVSKTGNTVTITDGSGHTVTITDGEDGQSIRGDDGEDAYFHVAWANSADGRTDFSTTVATNKLYMGTYTDHTQTDSQQPQSYKWVKVKGEQGVQGIQGIQGEQGIQGIQGAQGEQGDTGVGVESVQPQYYLSTSPSSASGGSWSTALTYVVGKYIWTRDYITYDDGTHGTSTAIYNQALTQSCLDAANALGLIQEQQEYFYHDTLGAHVLSSTDTTGTRYRTDIKGAGLEINELANGAETTVAKFGADEVQIGKDDERNMLITSDAVEIKDGETTKASFGENVIIGRAGEYHTSIEDDSFGISAGYEQIFDVSNGTGTKQITETDVLKPFKTMGASTAQYTRTGSLWIKQSTTYTFTLYNSSSEQNSTTFNTDVDGTSAKTKSFYLNLGPQGKNTVTLSFTPATDESGNSGMVCDWTQLYERFSSNEGYLLRFFITHAATIRNPVMSFVGDINLTYGATYKVNGESIEYVVERGATFETDLETNDWNYEKWSSGKVEAWAVCKTGTLSMSAAGNMYKSSAVDILIPSGIFPATPTFTQAFMHFSSGTAVSAGAAPQSATSLKAQIIKTTNNTNSVTLRIHAVYYPSGY